MAETLKPRPFCCEEAVGGMWLDGKFDPPYCPVHAPSEPDTLNDIAVMMSEFVDNWPEPKRLDTALKLIAKTLRGALASSPTAADLDKDAEIAALRLAMHNIDIIASNTIPPDGKDAAFGALNEITKLLNPFRIAALTQGKD